MHFYIAVSVEFKAKREKWEFFHRLFYFHLLKLLFLELCADGLSVYFPHWRMQGSLFPLSRATKNGRIITAAEEGGR